MKTIQRREHEVANEIFEDSTKKRKQNPNSEQDFRKTQSQTQQKKKRN